MVGVHQWVHAHPKVVADVRETGRGALATHAGGMQRAAAAVLRPPGLGWLDEGVHENEERLAEPVAVDAWLPGARRWKNDGGQARVHGGIHGGRFPKRARNTIERGRESGDASE